jgi:hypothetical protein
MRGLRGTERSASTVFGATARALFLAAGSMLAVALMIAACSSTGGSAFGNGAAGTAGDGGGSLGALGGNGDGGNGACQGLGCKKVSCKGGATTTISGQVFDPAGKNPLYDVAVFVPSTMPLPALSTGVSCDRCGATVTNPAASAITDENGKFTLTDAPVDANVPVVIQVGKWRKTYTLATVNSCVDNPMPTPLTLPKNGSEGDIPEMAVAVAHADALECLLVGMGLDASEFSTGPSGAGHVHMFPSATNQDLWASEATLSPYDIVLLDCEGDEVASNKTNANLQGMHDYAGAGGRIFATHYHYIWFKGSSLGVVNSVSAPADFVSTANWKPTAASGASGSGTYSVDQSFPKGVSFAKWLVNVGASSTLGSIPLDKIADSVVSVNNPPSTQWISGSGHVQYMSFNTPTTVSADQQCGRAVFSDLHVSGSGASSFPSDCSFDKSGDLTPQQKALEFLFFDLSSCVESNGVAPTPPR